FNLQGGSISSLRVEGAIHGDLIAGGNISGIQIGKSLSGGIDVPSVQRILTGTAANNLSTQLGDTNRQITDFTVTGNGGNITNVTLARGAEALHTGRGADNAGGAGFN